MSARNKATFARLHDGLNSGDLELVSKTIDQIFDPDVRFTAPLPMDVTGAEALKQIWVTLLQAYPDLHVTVEDLIAEGDRLVARNTVTATHRGEYLGRAATGRAVTYDEIFIVRFADGRIVETWGVVDVLSQLKPRGCIPA